MSRNSSTYLKLVGDTATIGTSGVVQFETSSKYVHSLLIGIDGTSASASTGVWVGASTVTATNQQGAKITAGSNFSASAIANDRGTIPLDLSNYYVAGASGDTVWCLYLEEYQQGV